MVSCSPRFPEIQVMLMLGLFTIYLFKYIQTKEIRCNATSYFSDRKQTAVFSNSFFLRASLVGAPSTIVWATSVRWRDIKDNPKTEELFPALVAKTLTDESIVTGRCISHEDINIIVTGGAGSHSIFLTPWIKTRTVTTSIDKWM